MKVTNKAKNLKPHPRPLPRREGSGMNRLLIVRTKSPTTLIFPQNHITPLPAGEGLGVGLLLLVILNHLKHVGNLLDAFLQGLLHHLLDEHIEFGLDGEFHLA